MGGAKKTGFGQWTKYILHVQSKDVSINNSAANSAEEKIILYIVKHGSINNRECRELLDVNDTRASCLLKKLSEKGKGPPIQCFLK